MRIYYVRSRAPLIALSADFCSFLRPTHSWGHLRIGFEAFKLIMAAQNLSAAFLDFMMSFGSRIEDCDGNIGGYGRHCVYAPRGVSGKEQTPFEFLVSHGTCNDPIASVTSEKLNVQQSSVTFSAILRDMDEPSETLGP